MKYVPGRDYRFEYLDDVMLFVEEYQCGTCAFKSDRPDYPMCFEVEAELFAENGPVQALDDLGEHGVECVRYRNVDDYTFPDPLQMELFDEGLDS